MDYSDLNMLEFRPDDYTTIPTKQGMVISNVHYISCSRTTLCDIMCTVNASINFDVPVAPEKLQPLEATLPYKKTQRQNPMKAKVTNATIFQKFKMEGNKSVVVEELKRDKERFMQQLQLEKHELDTKKYNAAIKFQSLYRGFKCRKPSINYVRKKKRKRIPTQFEMHDELCSLASTLGLKPVNGLSLEPRSKSSRRREKILNAAAFRIAHFIAMIAARNVARVILAVKKQERVHMCACVVTRAVRYVKVRKFVKKCEGIKRDRCATKIQNCVRIFFAKHRVRFLKQMNVMKKKFDESAIIIQRNFASKYRANNLSRVTRLALRHVVLMCNKVLDDISDVLLNEAIATCIDFYLKHLISKVDGAVVKAIDLVIDHIFLNAVSEETQLWFEQQMQAMALEKLNALQTDRLLLETTMENLEIVNEEVLPLKSSQDTIPTSNIAITDITTTSTTMIVSPPPTLINTILIPQISINENILEKVPTPTQLYLPLPTEIELNVNNLIQDMIRNIIDVALVNVYTLLPTLSTNIEVTSKQSTATTSNIILDEQVEKVALRSKDDVVRNDSMNELFSYYRNLAADIVSSTIATTLSKLSTATQSIAKVSIIVAAEEEEQEAAAEEEQEEVLVQVIPQDLSLDIDEMSAVSMGLDQTFEEISIADEENIEVGAVIEEWEITRYFVSVNLTLEEKTLIDMLFKKTYQEIYDGKYDKAWIILDKFPPVLALFPSTDTLHPDVARLYTTIKVLQATILFSQAQYVEAKVLYDEVLSERMQVFGISHLLTVEANYYLGEWFRSQAMYNESEQILIQSTTVVEALLKEEAGILPINDPEDRVDLKLWHLYNKLLLCHVELLRHCGQYYKSNNILLKLQASLKLYEFKDVQSISIQESFICCVISMLIMNGKFTNALVLQNELLRKRKSRFKKAVHPKIATSLCSLGNLKLLRCEFEEAARLLEESLDMRKKLYRSDHPAIAASLCARAKAFMKLGRYGEATADITLSLEMRLKKLGAQHPSVAESVLVLATVQTLSGDSLRAWKNHIYALQTYRDKYGVDKHRDVGNCVFAMGCNSLERGSYIESISYFEEVLRIRESLIPMLAMYSGSDQELKRNIIIDSDVSNISPHLDVEVAKLFLARAYLYVSRIDESKSLMKLAVKNITKIVGSQNDITALGLYFLGDLCKTRGNLLDAKQLYSLSFEIAQGLFGDDHPMIATLMLASADNLQFPGYYTEAQELIQSALEVRSLVFGSNNIYTSLALFQKGQLMFQMGKVTEAEELYIHAMHILIAKLGENSGLYGLVLGEFADCCRVIGKHDFAEKYFHQAIDIQKNNFGDKSIRMHLSICSYTFLLLDCHQPNDAYNILLNTVIPCFVQLLGLNHPYTLYAKANAALALQFSAFFEKQGTSEASQILDGIMQHPDILVLIESCNNAKFSPSHPWLLRFKEIDQSSETIATMELDNERNSLKGGINDNSSIRSGTVRRDRSISPPRKHSELRHTRSQVPDDRSFELDEQPSLTEYSSTDNKIINDYRDYVANSSGDDRSQTSTFFTDDVSSSSYYKSKHNKDDYSEEDSQYSQYSGNIYSKRNYSSHIDYEDDLSYDSRSITFKNNKTKRNYSQTPSNIKQTNDKLVNVESSIIDQWGKNKIGDNLSLVNSIELDQQQHSIDSQSYEDDKSLISYGMDSYYSR